MSYLENSLSTFIASELEKIQPGETLSQMVSQANVINIQKVNQGSGTKKSYNDMCTFYRTPIYFYGTKETLGHCIGKEMRASVAVIEEGFAKGIEKKLKDSIIDTEVNK